MAVARETCACVLLLLLLSSADALLSGLYVDNGIDQTIIQHSLSKNERQVVEHEILDLLGLGVRPRRSRAPSLERSAPSFLLDVYKQMAEEHEQARPTRSSEMALSVDEQHAIDESDLIMTFQSKKHHLGALRHGHGRHVWFDMSGAPTDAASLMGAELRLHQAPNPHQPELYTVTAHRVIDVNNLGKLQLERISSVNTSAGADGWLELNVTGAVSAWLASPADNRGFFLTVQPHSQPERDIKPEEIGLDEPRGSEPISEDKQPFLVAYFNNTAKIGSGDAGARRKRETNRQWRTSGYSGNYPRNPLTDTSHWTARSCEIQTLYVSFKDLEWQDWIIAPDGYSAFYCSGECNFPLNAHKNATNHAIVQTLVHLLNPTQVPKPSCAPKKLSHISVLYYTDDSNVILRKYKNMVVKSCGCH